MTAQRVPSYHKKAKPRQYPESKVEPHPIILIVAYFSIWLVGLLVYVLGSMT